MSVVTVGCRRSVGRRVCELLMQRRGEEETYKSRFLGRVPTYSEIGLDLKA